MIHLVELSVRQLIDIYADWNGWMKTDEKDFLEIWTFLAFLKLLDGIVDWWDGGFTYKMMFQTLLQNFKKRKTSIITMCKSMLEV